MDSTFAPSDFRSEYSASASRSRRRVGRACDECSLCRTRCNGERPCSRCIDLGARCRYDREVKRRGRRKASPRLLDRRLLQRKTTPYSNSIGNYQAQTTSPGLERIDAPAVSLATPGVDSEDLVSAGTCGPVQWIDRAQSAGEAERLCRRRDYPALAEQECRLQELDTPFKCHYSCLEPIIPSLQNIVPLSEACHLLDIYFAEPGNSTFSIHSPYVLTPVLRKKSLLLSTTPRSTSPALISTILWSVAHTANSESFRFPGARERIINRLYFLSLSLLRRRDIDNWHRVPGGWRWEEDCTMLSDTSDAEVTWNTFSKQPEFDIDDVLTYILLAVVISGGEFKADCLKWWNKATRRMHVLGCHSDATLSHSVHEADAQEQSLRDVEKEEEKRRIFWLVYALDRHLALSHNKPLQVLESECQVLTPLPEDIWQDLDSIPTDMLPSRTWGPPTRMSGIGFFEYFLPLMAILGDIIDVRTRRQHPRLGMADERCYLAVISQSLNRAETSLQGFRQSLGLSRIDSNFDHHAISIPDEIELCVLRGRSFESERQDSGSATDRAKLAIAYAEYIIQVLHVLLHGKWDAISILEDNGDWLTSSSFSECASKAIAAARSVSNILSLDPELSFMPYLFGIYLFHGSFILLLFADRMAQIGPNASVEQACEVIIRAHEVSVATLSTEFQRNFRKALRSTLYSVRRPESVDPEMQKIRKEVLSMYRWTRGGDGLCL